MGILTILEKVTIQRVVLGMVFFNCPFFSAAETTEKVIAGHGSPSVKPADEAIEQKEKSSARQNNYDLKTVRNTINDGAFRIVKSLGCLVDDEKQFDQMVAEWGKKVFELGPEPKMITEKTRYSSYLRFVAWDYLKSDKVCASTSNRCYQKLYKPVDQLFSFFRENDVSQSDSKIKLEKLKLELKENVQNLRNLNNTKPTCVLEKTKENSEKQEYKEKHEQEKQREIEPLRINGSEGKVQIAKDLPSRQSLMAKSHSSKASEEKASTSDKQIEAYREAFLAKGADPVGVENTLKFFETNREKFKNQRYISLIDATKKSTDEPYFLLDTQTLDVKRYDVSFGRGTVAGRNGLPVNFSRANVSGSYQTPPGALLVGDSAHGNSHSRITYLHGLEDRNKATFSRSVVMHDAPYVHNGGRSHGCPALDPKDFNRIQPLISGGSLLYIYSPFADKNLGGSRST